MLKLQLGSKIAGIVPDWRSSEDLLTCDFFGVLDYLPRQPYLRDFLAGLVAAQPAVQIPLDEVDWDRVEFRFWPRLDAHDEGTEPDVVLLSNRWVVVIEAKLHAGFGARQPVREYTVGRQLAAGMSIPEAHVYYVLISKYRLDIRSTFGNDPKPLCDALVAHTLNVRWSDVYRIVDRWLQSSNGEHVTAAERVRLLNDVHRSMRLRPALTFSGFRFIGDRSVGNPESRYFSPDPFTGFLSGYDADNAVSMASIMSIGTSFRGFMMGAPTVPAAAGLYLAVDGFGKPSAMPIAASFRGFMMGAPAASATGQYLVLARFGGFLVDGPRCELMPDGFGLANAKGV